MERAGRGVGGGGGYQRRNLQLQVLSIGPSSLYYERSRSCKSSSVRRVSSDPRDMGHIVSLLRVTNARGFQNEATRLCMRLCCCDLCKQNTANSAANTE